METSKVQRFKTKILEIKNICDDVKHFVIKTNKDFLFKPGQFISIILNIDGKEIRRPYSIASAPYPNSLELCIKILPNGKATPTIDELKEGDEIEIIGPMGRFTLHESSEKKDLILISTGTGITPFRSLANHLLKKEKESIFKNKITLITGYRYEENCLYEPEFKKLEKNHSNFSYHGILSRPRDSQPNQEKGHVQLLVEKHINPNAHYYLCGLTPMIDSVRELLKEKGIKKEQIFFEKYD
jgi:ferredoxin-NADP reductase